MPVSPVREHAVTVAGGEGGVDPSVFLRELSRCQARPVSLFAFGGLAGCARLQQGLKGFEGGISWLTGDSSRHDHVSSVQVFAVSGGRPVQVLRRGATVGTVYEDKSARYCRLSSVVPVRCTASREAQALEVFETAEALLQECGFRFQDTVRTWFYLDRLLEWYAAFNAVRTRFFKSRGVFAGIVPASTGIGAGNAAGAALTCDLLAVQRGDGLSIRSVASPLQESAMEYKSSFSRAVEISTPVHRTLMISGTASIDKGGRSVHAGDAASQMALTMEVVEALLQSRSLGWGEVTRAIAYFKRLADHPLLSRYLAGRGIAPFPMALAEADICRHDLLFEIEVDAVSP